MSHERRPHCKHARPNVPAVIADDGNPTARRVQLERHACTHSVNTVAGLTEILKTGLATTPAGTN